VLDGNGYTSIDIAGASSTQAFGINPAGVIVGTYDGAGGTHGFCLRLRDAE